MASHAADDTIEYCGIRLTAKSLYSVEHGQPAVVVPCDGIRRIVISDGTLAPHPILLAIFGIFLILFGIIPVAFIVQWMKEGGSIHLAELLPIPVVVFGISLLVNASRRGQYIRVVSPIGERRLVFHRSADRQGIDQFVSRLEMALGVKVERDFSV